MEVPKCVDDCSTMEELVAMFAEKTSLIRDCIELRPFSCNVSQCLHTLSKGTAELQSLLSEIGDEMKIAEDNEANIQKLYARLQSVEKRVAHASEYCPDVIPKVAVVHRPGSDSSKTKPVTSTCPDSQRKPVKRVPVIMSLSPSEFQAVPKYMKGRITLEGINNFIQDFNKTIASKYQYLTMPRAQLGNNDYKLVQEMKSQETAETKGLHFCLLQDLKKFGSVKIENSAKAMLTILRHCSRIKEIRGPGPIVRYVAIDS